MGQVPVGGKRIVGYPSFAFDAKTGGAQPARKLLRRDKMVPVMGTAWHPMQHIFGANDRERKALQCTVERCRNKHSAGADHLCSLVKKTRDVTHVLDDLHGEDSIEDSAPCRKLLGRDAAVVDSKICLCGMIFGYLDVAARRID